MRQRLGAATAVAVGLLWPAIAVATATDFEMLQPDPALDGAPATRAPVPPPGGGAIGAWLQHEHRPVVQATPGGSRALAAGVSYRLQAHVLASWSLRDRVWLSLDMPATLSADQLVDETYTPQARAWNDLRLEMLAPLWRGKSAALGVVAFTTVSTGRAAAFAGSDDRALQPGGVLAAQVMTSLGRLRLNAGYEELDRTRLTRFRLTVDDRILYRAAWLVDAGPALSLAAELDGATPAAAPFRGLQGDRRELRGAISFRSKGGAIVAGMAGVGISRGYGVPSWRGGVLVGYRLGQHSPAPAALPPVREGPAAPVNAAPGQAPVGTTALQIQVVAAPGTAVPGAIIVLSAVKGAVPPAVAQADAAGTATFELPAGPYRVQVSAPGYRGTTISVEVQRERTRAFRVRLLPEVTTGRLDIAIVDADSGVPLTVGFLTIPEAGVDTIFYDGAFVVDVEPRTYTVNVRVDGYLPEERSATVARPGHSVSLVLRMTKSGGGAEVRP